MSRLARRRRSGNRRDAAAPLAWSRRRVTRGLALAALLATTGLAAALPGSPVRAAEPPRLRWLAIGDSGSGDSRQRRVGELMAAAHRRQAVDLVLLAGDNIYPDGDLRRIEATFLRPYRELLHARVPFHAVLGNHDIRTANGDPQVSYAPFGMQGRWYALRRGPVEFFLLDTNGNARWERQLPWLEQALARSRAPWKVVVGHHTIYSSGIYGDNPAAQARLGPLFRRHGVQLSINGHEHFYERSRPINGTTYVQVGIGGASLRPVQPGPNTAVAVSSHGFAEFSASEQRLDMVVWNDRGERIDRLVLQR